MFQKALMYSDVVCGSNSRVATCWVQMLHCCRGISQQMPAHADNSDEAGEGIQDALTSDSTGGLDVTLSWKWVLPHTFMHLLTHQLL